jgi:formylglycine-generating enzyme required for sulfatase activity
LNGISPYGVLDMSGNVREWTRSESKDYPYYADDGREDLNKKVGYRAIRGGSFEHINGYVSCACRGGDYPRNLSRYLGFRIVIMTS